MEDAINAYKKQATIENTIIITAANKDNCISSPTFVILSGIETITLIPNNNKMVTACSRNKSSITKEERLKFSCLLC